MSDERRTLADDGLPTVGGIIRQFDLRARKSLGQNFLLDLNVTRKIAGLCGELDDQIVVEIGPGPGGLTRSLLFEGAERVVALERDERCLPALQLISDRWPHRLTVLSGDALKMSLASVMKAASIEDGKRFRIISNLPYGIATQLLIDWLEVDDWPPLFSGMALMFQREVAERIVAGPGSKAYGRLAVLSQWSCQVAIAMRLPAAAFTPPPKVDSAVVTFVPRDVRRPTACAKMVGRVTGAVFGQRRKMLRSSLRQLTNSPLEVLQDVGIAPDLRGECVTVAQFAELAARLEQEAKT